MRYVQLTAESRLGDLSELAPFKAVAIIESSLSNERWSEIGKWLVDEGCLYLMAWGRGCGALTDAVNLANLQEFNFGTIPDDRLIICTVHENESLQDVFWFSKHTAKHPCSALNETLLHVAPINRESELTEQYMRA